LIADKHINSDYERGYNDGYEDAKDLIDWNNKYSDNGAGTQDVTTSSTG
jgi:hypothetical protein